ncbi:hypothetical protein BgiBS90_016155, partial [Biomphalaria glabrata]
ETNRTSRVEEMTNSENMGARGEECEHLGDSVAEKCCTLYHVLPPLLGMAAETGGQRIKVKEQKI